VEQDCRAHRHRIAVRPCQAWTYLAGRRIIVGLWRAALSAGGVFMDGALGAASAVAL
jgi:hypothetical protein